MRSQVSRARALAVVAVASTLCAPSVAQTTAETNAPGVQLNFSVPGARSLGMGGAFLGMSDDATTAYANPAGLVNLSRPELSLELREWSFSHVFTDSGDARREPLGLVDGAAEDERRGISFASFVYPGKIRRRAAEGQQRRRTLYWAVAPYQHQLADFEANFETEGAVLSPQSRIFPATTSMSLEIVNRGVSAAYLFDGADLSLGLGLSRYEFEIESTTSRFAIATLDEAADRSTRNVHDSQIQSGTDDDWVLTAGLHWRPLYRLSVGAVFRQGADFGFVASTTPGDRASPLVRERGTVSRQARFRVPDIYGVGVAYTPVIWVRIGLDYYRIRYSQFTEDLVDVFDLPPEIFDGRPPSELFTVDDGDQFHLGLDFRLPKRWFLRMGVWRDPDHGIRFLGTNAGFRAIFRPRDDETHYAGGLGYGGGRLRLDAAVDRSDRLTTLSFSTVARF